MTWTQTKIKIEAKPRGSHLITSEILSQLPKLNKTSIGIMHLFIQHTSASLTINENADPDVRIDLEMALNKIAPENLPYVHTAEGPDDMPAHVKSSIMGNSLSIPHSGARGSVQVESQQISF